MNRILRIIIAGTGLFVSGTLGIQAQLLNEQAFKFGTVLEWINKYYVDSVNQDLLVEHAITALLKDLDPHSSYLTKEEVDELNEPLQGNFEGIGVSFNILDDTVYIISPIAGGPSDKVGVMPGDRIVRVDGKNVAGIGISSDKVYALLRGKKGSKVTISIQRRDVPRLIDFEIIRDRIPIHSIDASYQVSDDIGYIKINRFSMTTMDEFNAAIEKLKEQHVKNLILDLTGNGGGYLEVAIKLADQFLDAGKLILYTEGINSPRKDYVATREGNFEKGHLVILIDEGSASASEILSGAVQDWDRGIIVGRRSYGKGLVQKPLLLPDQSMIRLTVAKYYTPTGRLIQKPYQMNREEYEKELLTRYTNGELVHKDSIQFPDSLKYYTRKNARLVYGGGGIMPDFFVSIDTSYYSDYFRQLIRNGTINRFVLDYVDRNRSGLLRQYPDFQSFRHDFEVEDNLLFKLIRYAENNGIPEDKADLSFSREQIALMLKAYIARDLWSTNEYYEITNASDPKFESAVTILNNWDQYEVMLLNKK